MRRGNSVNLKTLLAHEKFQRSNLSDIVTEIVNLFLLDSREYTASLVLAHATADLASARRQAHALRSGASSIGAERLATLCENMEKVPQLDLRLLEEIKSELEAVAAELDTVRRRRAANFGH